MPVSPPTNPISSLADLRARLLQVPAGQANDDLLQSCLNASQALIEEYLKYSYAGYTTSSMWVISYGSPYLIMPASYRSGSITQIADVVGQVVPSQYYQEQPDGIWLVQSWLLPPPINQPDTFALGWIPGKYSITADYGWGQAPADIQEVCLEVASNIWKEIPKGSFSDVVGVEGSGGEIRVGYTKALTNRQQMVLELHHQDWLNLRPLTLG